MRVDVVRPQGMPLRKFQPLYLTTHPSSSITMQIVMKNGDLAVQDVNGRTAKVRSKMAHRSCYGMYCTLTTAYIPAWSLRHRAV